MWLQLPQESDNGAQIFICDIRPCAHDRGKNASVRTSARLDDTHNFGIRVLSNGALGMRRQIGRDYRCIRRTELVATGSKLIAVVDAAVAIGVWHLRQ